MKKLSISKEDFMSLSIEYRHALVSLCLILLGANRFELTIDNISINDRDAFFDWQLENNILTSK